MRWLIVLVGLALAAIGGGAVYATLAPSGAERAFVIALAACLAVSAGASMVALGLALGHVDRLAADLRARIAAVQAGVSSSAAADTYAAPRPGLAKPPSAWAAPAFPASASQAEDGAPASLPPEFLRRGEPAAKPAAMSSAPQPAREPAADALVKSILAETAVAAPAAASAAAAPLVHAVDWQRETAAAGQEDRMPEAPVPYKPAAPQAAPEHMAAAPVSAAPAPPAEALASPPPPDPPPHAPQPSVIGRYNAGGAAYIMFSDGTIEAETAGGTFRFSSMSELREFIEARSHSNADA